MPKQESITEVYERAKKSPAYQLGRVDALQNAQIRLISEGEKAAVKAQEEGRLEVSNAIISFSLETSIVLGKTIDQEESSEDPPGN